MIMLAKKVRDVIVKDLLKDLRKLAKELSRIESAFWTTTVFIMRL
jgi:hypothetical protein